MKEFRLSTGMTQAEFAEHFDIPVRTLQDWEQGRRVPPSYIIGLMKRVWELEQDNDSYTNGRTDREKELEKAFVKLHGAEYSWWEILELAERLKE